MKVSGVFEKDFKSARDIFPKLSYEWLEKYNSWLISGELDICSQGYYWDTFKIEISVPVGYPYCIPIVKEVSTIIPRIDERHITKAGVCCLDIEHKLLFKSKKGINIFSFIKDIVYPYFANQLFYNSNGKYAAGEYKHHFEGIAQFYLEELDFKTPKLSIAILESILSGSIPGRNEPCLCGSRKFKRCHWDSVKFLKSLGKEILKKDLMGFIDGNFAPPQ